MIFKSLVFFDTIGNGAGDNLKSLVLDAVSCDTALCSSSSQLAQLSKLQIQDKSFFYGSFSPYIFDFATHKFIKIAILLPPALRILNSFAWLRQEGFKHHNAGHVLPPTDFRSLASIYHLEDFLLPTSEPAISFIKNAFDNFYTYYFGTRTLNGRPLIRDTYGESDDFITGLVAENARDNIERDVKVFPIFRLHHLSSFLIEAGFTNTKALSYSTNLFPVNEDNQADFIADHSKDAAKIEDLLYSYTRFDQRLYDAIM